MTLRLVSFPSLCGLLLALGVAPWGMAEAEAAPLALADGRITYHIDHPFKQADGWLEKRFMTASLDFDAGNPGASKFSIILDATAFDTGNDLRDSHQQEQIGAETFKTVKYQATSLVLQSKAAEGGGERWKFMAYGKMQFHGVVKDVSWPVEVLIAGSQITVDSGFNLNITDYGMSPKSIVGVAVNAVVPVKVHLVFNR